LFLGFHHNSNTTITEIANYYKISRNHLVKIVHNLSMLGYIKTTRGKGGGLRLAVSPDSISIGDIVRKMEPNFNIVECFDKNEMPCMIEDLCQLKSVLNNAKQQFLSVLDQHTLAQAIKNKQTTVHPVEFIRELR
jgi:Rrf2 family nitric oxide-sensitive transcriptional repressor